MGCKKIFMVIIVLGIFSLFSCGPKPVAPKAELDTPMHHVQTGNKLLKAGKIDEAFQEFNRAKELDPKYSSAYIGIGIVQGLKNEFTEALESMKKAGKYAEGDAQEAAVHVGYMRLYLMGGEKIDKKWLRRVEDAFEDATDTVSDFPDPYFYMGMAYKKVYDFPQASEHFKKVLNLNKGFIEEADKEYAAIQHIERATPGSGVGKKIALLDKITRADIAALFIQELKIDELFAKRTPKEFDTAYQNPEKKFVTGEYVKVPLATDIENHVLKADIESVMKIGIKGLQPLPDHTYQPDKTITRAEFAMMIQDILIKITRDETLSTRFIGSESPFPDLRSDLSYFNAAMVCTTRGIMDVKDVSTGEFDPTGTVSGAESLLSIRALKIELNKFQ